VAQQPLVFRGGPDIQSLQLPEEAWEGNAATARVRPWKPRALTRKISGEAGGG